MKSDPLKEYRRKRDPGRTPEPVPPAPPEGPLPRGRDDTFIIQQHHARALHWDLRLERDGVLVSWAVPRGVPRDPNRNHLAVHTEDHPLEYASFQGDIPAGEYGGGNVRLYDRGTYLTEKWRDDEVIVVFDGSRVRGRYALFRTRRKQAGGAPAGGTAQSRDDWMIHRMDPPEPGWTPMPEPVAPMRPVRVARLPADDAAWGYEMAWDGRRTLGYVSGGRLVLRDADGADITRSHVELRPLGDRLAPTEAVLDGVLAELGGATMLLLSDVLWLDGQSTVDLPYRRRRELLEGLELAGPHWQTPPYFAGSGRQARQTARDQGLPGVLAKRLDSRYQSQKPTRAWLFIPG
ncbi:MAG: ATP-dependent DNA ligase [Micromonosporaceae bacterium]|nr:ATP-dependent DNA ligase [Micromonosporaceae bacterium]